MTEQEFTPAPAGPPDVGTLYHDSQGKVWRVVSLAPFTLQEAFPPHTLAPRQRRPVPQVLARDYVRMTAR